MNYLHVQNVIIIMKWLCVSKNYTNDISRKDKSNHFLLLLFKIYLNLEQAVENAKNGSGLLHIHKCKIFMNILQAAAILAFSTTCSRFEKILNNNKLRRLDFSFQMMATGILLVLMIYINDPRFKL